MASSTLTGRIGAAWNVLRFGRPFRVDEHPHGGARGGVVVTEDSAMQLATAWSCVRYLSEVMGSLPWAVYTVDDRGSPRRIDDDPLSMVLRDSPNINMTSQEMREALMLQLVLRGNGYARIRRSRGDITSVTPYRVGECVPVLKNGVLKYTETIDGHSTELSADDVWHLKGFGGDGLVGLSPIAYARTSMGLALNAERFGSEFYTNGAQTTGIVTTESWLTDPQRQRAKQIMDEKVYGMQGAHKWELFEGGMKFAPVTMPLEDAQFLETRKFQSLEICRWFRVPPHKVADLERATFSNIEQQGLDVVQDTLVPYARRFEETFEKRLLRPEERGKKFLRFNFEGLLRADSQARSQLYATLLQNGVSTSNEVRRLENMPLSDDPAADQLRVQSNMTLLDALKLLAPTAPGG